MKTRRKIKRPTKKEDKETSNNQISSQPNEEFIMAEGKVPDRQTVQLITTPSLVTPFPGRLADRSVPVDIDLFLTQIEDALNRKSATSDEDFVAELRANIDVSKGGDAFGLINTPKFHSLKGKEAIKEYLKSAYSRSSKGKGLLALSEILEAKKGNISMEGWCNELVTRLDKTIALLVAEGEWKKADPEVYDAIREGLITSLVLVQFPKEVREVTIKRKKPEHDANYVISSAMDEWEKRDPSLGAGEVVAHTQNYAHNNRPQHKQQDIPKQQLGTQHSRPPQRPHVRPQQGQHTRPHQGQHTRPHQGQHSRPLQGQNVRPSQGWSGQSPHSRKCFNCQEKGHVSSNCTNRPFCPIHGIQGHRLSECRSRPHSQVSNNPRDNSQGGHQSGEAMHTPLANQT